MTLYAISQITINGHGLMTQYSQEPWINAMFIRVSSRDGGFGRNAMRNRNIPHDARKLTLVFDLIM